MEKSCPTHNVDFLFHKSEKLSLLLYAIQQTLINFIKLTLF